MLNSSDIDFSSENRSKQRNQSPNRIISPNALISQLECSPHVKHYILQKREEISKIIHGEDDRLLVIVGPCSIHDVDEALNYAKKLKTLAHQYETTLLIVMRVYVEKPRTTYGWKGLIYDPHLDGSNDIQYGLKISRKLLIDINNLQLPCSCEFLQPLIVNYLSDLISWAAIGARTTESQIHRELVSGLNVPIGFKNNTNGCVQVAIDACIASQRSHSLLSTDHHGNIICHDTNGNHNVHVVLRGGTATGPNYSSEHVNKARDLLKKNNIKTKVMVDCSHGNAMKNHENQINVVDDICHQLTHGDKTIMGIMIESNLLDGNQMFVQGNKHLLQYGKSITDPCIGWNSTMAQMRRLSTAVLERRKCHKQL